MSNNNNNNDVDVYARLKTETAAMLGYDVANLSPLQSLRLNVACVLQLELDRAAALQARGEAVDIKALTTAAEALEHLLRPAAAPPDAVRRSEGREKLRALIESTLATGDQTRADEHAVLKAENEALRAELQARAAPAPTAAPSADIVPPAPDPLELAKAREAARIKAIATAPRDAPWRNSVTEDGCIRTSFGPFGIHKIPRDF
jgi:hypothetical protein